MKRFIAYILLCVSILFSAFIGFVPSVLSINASADYDSGQNFIYKISLKDDGDKNDGDIESGDALNSVIEVFKDRLDAANISTYKLESEGNDTIRLAFKDKSEINTYVSKYLNFDANIQAMDYSGKIILEASEFLEKGGAYIDYTNNTPTVVLPLADPEGFKTKLYENINGSKSNDSTSSYTKKPGELQTFADDGASSGEEESTSNENYLYIVNNWKSETYSMKTIIEENSSADTDENNAYIDRIDATSASNFFFDYDADNPGNTFTKLKYTGFFNDASGDLTLANRLANIVVKKFNASSLDYKVTLINKDYINSASNNVTAFIESLIYHGDKYGQYRSIVMSSLLISTIVAFVVTSLFLVLNYGIAGLTSIVITPAMIISTLAIFNSFGAEFNVGTIIALIGVAIISIFSGAAYFKSVKENLYRGKNLRKANQDASKNTAFIQIDLSVISVILGLVSYLIPNSIMLSIGAVLILGGLINILLNGILLRAMYYFLANSTFIDNHLNLLMVEKKKIPDLSKDEKPVYFEQFKKKDKIEKKNKTKVLGIIGTALLFVSALGITTFQLINGNIYNSNSDVVTSSRVYLEFDYKDNGAIKTVSDLEKKVLSNLYTYNEETGVRSTNTVSYDDILNFTYSYKENYDVNKETLKKDYYIIELNDIINENTKFSAYVDSIHYEENVSIEDALQYLIVDYNNASNFTSVELKSVKNVNSDTNNYYCLLFASIGTAIVGVYMMFRFGVSRGLVSILFVAASSTIVTGIFTLCRGHFNSQITFGVVLLTILGFAILDNYYAVDREIRKENHLDKDNFAGLKEDSKFAIRLANQNVTIMSMLSAFVVISFLFAKSFSMYFVLFVVLGLFLMLMFYKELTVPVVYKLSSFFGSIWKKIGSRYEAHRAKVNEKRHKKDDGDGPQEAIFIGIND